MRITAVPRITPALRLCYNCRHEPKSLEHPVCATCHKYANWTCRQYSNWQEVLEDAVSRHGDSPQNGRPV